MSDQTDSPTRRARADALNDPHVLELEGGGATPRPAAPRSLSSAPTIATEPVESEASPPAPDSDSWSWADVSSKILAASEHSGEKRALRLRQLRIRDPENVSLPPIPSLTALDLGKTVLSKPLPTDWVQGVPALEELRLDKCQLLVVPPLTPVSATLRILTLRRNSIEELNLPSLPSLVYLDLRNNRLPLPLSPASTASLVATMASSQRATLERKLQGSWLEKSRAALRCLALCPRLRAVDLQSQTQSWSPPRGASPVKWVESDHPGGSQPLKSLVVSLCPGLQALNGAALPRRAPRSKVPHREDSAGQNRSKVSHREESAEQNRSGARRRVDMPTLAPEEKESSLPHTTPPEASEPAFPTTTIAAQRQTMDRLSQPRWLSNKADAARARSLRQSAALAARQGRYDKALALEAAAQAVSPVARNRGVAFGASVAVASHQWPIHDDRHADGTPVFDPDTQARPASPNLVDSLAHAKEPPPSAVPTAAVSHVWSGGSPTTARALAQRHISELHRTQLSLEPPEHMEETEPAALLSAAFPQGALFPLEDESDDVDDARKPPTAPSHSHLAEAEAKEACVTLEAALAALKRVQDPSILASRLESLGLLPTSQRPKSWLTGGTEPRSLAPHAARARELAESVVQSIASHKVPPGAWRGGGEFQRHSARRGTSTPPAVGPSIDSPHARMAGSVPTSSRSLRAMSRIPQNNVGMFASEPSEKGSSAGSPHVQPPATASSSSAQTASQVSKQQPVAAQPEEQFGLSLGLLQGDWEVCVDPGTMCTFYYNHATGESSWVLPQQLAFVAAGSANHTPQ
jgi:hypothetical protein